MLETDLIVENQLLKDMVRELEAKLFDCRARLNACNVARNDILAKNAEELPAYVTRNLFGGTK